MSTNSSKIIFCATFLVLVTCVQYLCALFVSYTSVVEVTEGKLRGTRGLNGQNRYYGIPYATSKRFQPSQPPKAWSGIFYAESQFISCSQAISFVHLGTEDCLSLDIYTPQHSSRGQNLPVLVFFHGGGYLTGAKWNYDPEFLVEKDVVVVMINYRLGVHGFLCLNGVANLGLKDQVAALKWIQKNISAFGGDPDNVTICGQSSGAATASMHFMSKQSAGLFHKAILISGVGLAPWAFNVNTLTPAFQDAAKIVSRPVHNETDAYNIFLNAALDDLLTATQDVITEPNYFKYSPCNDANFTDPFFHDAPYNIIKSGDFYKVPTIIGVTDLEGMLLYSLTNPKSLQNLDDNFIQMLPSPFLWCSGNDKRKIAGKLRAHYFGTQRINSKASIKGSIALFSDWTIYALMDVFSKLMAKYSDKPIYNYIFTYEGGRSFLKNIFDPGFNLKGAIHNDDLNYLFNPIGLNLKPDELDGLLIDKFTSMFTNFMKYGNPTPKESKLLPISWPTTTANRSQVMRIDLPLSVSDTPDNVRGQFYLRLLCEHGLSGYVPCDSAKQCNLEQ